ncbi:MAG: hypothetical protein KBS81_04670 [Spirochaetales bacterium]|nr:hypothetical protein [Candidatus Physcosoma equi]
MERITRSELTALRLKRAAEAVKVLNSEIEELKQRLSLVEIHNEELQELINRIGESSATIAASINQSIETLDSDFIFNEDENKEIESAEAFSEVGSVDVDFDF